MDAPPPERTVPFNLDLVFRRGMGRRLLICILALSISPLILVGWINYQAAYRHLEKDIQNTIRLNAELKRKAIEAYLESLLADAERQGRQPATIAFYDALLRRRLTAEEPLSEFVLSPPWQSAVSAFGSGIRLHADLHGYPKILLIDLDGNVIHASADTGDRSGIPERIEAAGAAIGTAIRETLDTGRPVFCGFEPGAPEDNGVRAFITAAIGEPDTPARGVIAFQIPGRDIQQLLDTSPEPGENSRVYLIDSDLTLLAGTIDGQRPDTRLTMQTAIARRWREAVAGPASALPPPDLLDYQDPGGHWIVGTYATLQPGQAPYAVVVEIDRTMAMAGIDRQQKLFGVIAVLTGLAVLTASVILTRMLVEPVRDLTEQVRLAAHMRFDHVAPVFAGHELGRLALVCNDLITHIRALTIEHEIQSRLVAGMASLHRLLGGVQETGELCLKAIEFLTDFLDLNQADFYIRNEQGRLQCACRFPGHPACDPRLFYSPGEGRVGTAALEETLLAFRKDPAEGSVMPVPAVDLGNLVAMPLILQDTVIGGLEVEKTSVFSLFDGHFLQMAAEFIAITLAAALTRDKERALFEKTREQAEQLKLRETALELKTDELRAQSAAFQESEQVLQLKHLELEAANAQMIKNAADLEANMAILEQQKRDIQKQNAALEKAHRELADKARQLEISSQYKTEFMANMSHELRTPLNSILLLSRLLLENKENTLTTRQADFAQTIYSAGEDLLNLINEILDLAKVESGKIEMESAPVAIRSIANAMQRGFAPLAEQSGITFSIHVGKDVDEQLMSDRKRIEQIVKNFLSNAFKFTHRGSIRLSFATTVRPPAGPPANIAAPSRWISISVSDTGIGIPKSKQEMVFDAFQQVDGSTRRKYGGTGLGLSISRELARMLGGEITLESEEGKGSCFSLHLPVIAPSAAGPRMAVNGASTSGSLPMPSTPADEGGAASQPSSEPVPDDRHRLTPGNPCVLIIDTDAATIESVRAVAHEHGFKVVVAEQRMTGLHFADYYQPSAVFINPHRIVPDAWSVIDQIKVNPKNHHIPVFTFSDQDEKVEAAVHGAAGHILLPPDTSRLSLGFQQIQQWRSQPDRSVLMVAADPEQITATILENIGNGSIRFIPASTVAAAREALEKKTVDAVILHTSLDPDAQRHFLMAWQAQPIPLIVYTEKAAKASDTTAVRQFPRLAGLPPVNAPNPLLLALMARLHLPIEVLDDSPRHRLEVLFGSPSPMKGCRVLLVDDDMRTVFAVTSALEDHGVEVCTGKTGKESLDKLDSFPDIDLILMDVMIADVDGYQAIQQIRRRMRFNAVPIIALTAKAMQGDRAKCIAAGANDYLAKPVNLDKLTSMLKIWLDTRLVRPQGIHG